MLHLGLSLMCFAKFTVSPYLCEIEILSPHSFYGRPTATGLHSVRRQSMDKSSKVSDVDAHSCRHTDHCLQYNCPPPPVNKIVLMPFVVSCKLTGLLLIYVISYYIKQLIFLKYMEVSDGYVMA